MINELVERYPCLIACEQDIIKAQQIIIDCYEKGGKLILCGNGGSAADCEHIAGELMKGFLKKRPLSDEIKHKMKESCPVLTDETLSLLQQGLPAVSLPIMAGFNSAVGNDTDPALCYAQGVFALGEKKDLLFAISTSGNSFNVCKAAEVAKGKGMKVVSLTGKYGGKIKEISDVSLCVPETETYKIQELHLPVYHYLCAAVEQHFFSI